MSQADRNCILPDENQSINLLNKYSKSACEYECAISFSMNQCGCIPWNMPKNQAAEKLPLCELKADNCYEQMIRNFSTLDCGCKSGRSTNLHEIYLFVIQTCGESWIFHIRWSITLICCENFGWLCIGLSNTRLGRKCLNNKIY